MDVIGSSSNTHQNDSSGSSHDGKKNLTGTEAFVNHAEILWKQMRKEWVGDQSKNLQRPPRDSTICLTESYDDMFLLEQRFQPPVPLATMVRNLVNIWQEGYELGDR